MRTTIDAAGRLVIPKEIRRQAELQPGMPLEIRFCDGRIEIEPASSPVRLEERGGRLVAVSDIDAPPLTNQIVNEILDSMRRERGGPA